MLAASTRAWHIRRPFASAHFQRERARTHAPRGRIALTQ